MTSTTEGFKAWRQLTERFSPKSNVDEFAACVRLLEPKHMVPAKSHEQGLDNLVKWEEEVWAYESKFGEMLDSKTKMMLTRNLVPDDMFGPNGPFRGREISGYEEQRELMMRYMSDKSLRETQDSRAVGKKG